MRNANVPNSKEGHMRLTVNRILALVSLVAAGLMAGCSADSPGPTTPPSPPGSNGLVLILTTNDVNPKAGTCVLIQAVATQNGVAVPSGTSILLSATGGSFAQNGQQTISLVSQNGVVTTALCSDVEGPATVKGTVTVGANTAHGFVGLNFTTNGVPTGPFVSICANPHTGGVTGGTSVVISGGGFGTDATKVKVFFRSGAVVHQGVVSAVTDSQISVTTPAFPELAGLPATAVEVDVVLSGNTLASPNCFTYTTDTQPIVAAILPSSGSKVGGTRVTITGTGFSAPVQVFFGGTLEAQIVSVSSNEIIAITPPANGQGPSQSFPLDVPVVVKNVNCTAGSTCTSNPVTFTYTVGLSIFGFTPDQGDASTVVTITGQGFVAPLIVTFGGVQGTVISVSGTQILAKPPAGCSPGGVIAVTLLSTGETASSSSSFTGVAPTIKGSASPSGGPAGVGTPAIVRGTGFFPSGQASSCTVASGCVTATGGSVTGVSASETNGVQTINMTLTPDRCIASMTVTLTNTTTGCFTSFTFSNTTPVAPAPSANFTTGYPTAKTVVLTSDSTGGTLPYQSFTWSFSGNNAGQPTVVPTSCASGAACSASQITLTFDCGTPSGPPCTNAPTASLIVTDACGKASTPFPATLAPK